MLKVAGTAEERMLMALVDGLEIAAEGHMRVVLDLDDLILVSASAIRRFTSALCERVGCERLELNCSRRSGRHLLRR